MNEIRFEDLTLRESRIFACGYAEALDDLTPQLDEAIAMCRQRTAQLVQAQRDLANAEAGHWERIHNTHQQAAEAAARSIEIKKARAAHAAKYAKGKAA
ncbi:hypothetical protein [Leifsonia poae]|uniref:hypothetical protein n=1 Tax=Leifsonia poae TaxID=110933 RepID=UPI003D67C1AA